LANMRQTIKLLASLTICYAAAFFSVLFSGASRSDWYASLAKPVFMPPDWLFGPVWTLLYGMMAISLFLVWKRKLDRPGGKAACVVFLAQLIVNAIWSPVFFGLKMPGLALIVIIILWLLIFLTVALFGKLSRLGAWLLVPYLAWVTFATVLNGSILHLN